MRNARENSLRPLRNAIGDRAMSIPAFTYGQDALFHRVAPTRPHWTAGCEGHVPESGSVAARVVITDARRPSDARSHEGFAVT